MVQARPLDQLRAGDEPLFGGKSAGLGELTASGIAVPPGFAVSVGAFRSFLEEAELEAEVAKLLAALDPEDIAAVREASREIREAMRRAPPPEAVRAELEQHYAELAAACPADDPPVAVRSSALGEDSAQAPFAGQLQTFLWVRGADTVCESVLGCWASLFSPEAIAYRAQLAHPRPPAMGVAVQRMVDAEVSGVAFTCNPVSGDPSTVAVNASWGLGVAVVEGEVTPDEFRLSKVTGEVLHRSIAAKQVEYRPDPAGGTARLEVPEPRRDSPCLTEGALEALLELARRIEAHFGCHQDFEWAISRDEVEAGPVVLQSRPVTTKREPQAAARGHSAIDLVIGKFGADGGGD